MKVCKLDPVFKQIQITLETEKEADKLWEILYKGDHTDQLWRELWQTYDEVYRPGYILEQI